MTTEEAAPIAADTENAPVVTDGERSLLEDSEAEVETFPVVPAD